MFATIATLELVSDEAKNWALENIDFEDYQQIGDYRIAIEARFIDSIVEALCLQGFQAKQDFFVV